MDPQSIGRVPVAIANIGIKRAWDDLARHWIWAANAPSVLRAASYFRLASALVSGVIPVILFFVQPSSLSLDAFSAVLY